MEEPSRPEMVLDWRKWDRYDLKRLEMPTNWVERDMHEADGIHERTSERLATHDINGSSDLYNDVEHMDIILRDQEVDNVDRRSHSGQCLENRDSTFDVVQSNEHSCFTGETTLAAHDDDDAAQNTLAGFIFMCNKQTMKECFHHGIFGLPYNSWTLVSQVVPGTILFLFEYGAREMRGIYEATSYGALNINKHAYSKGSFPAQVRFKEIERCPPLGEDEFKDTIRENYYSKMKFHFELSYDQVYRLCTAFLWKVASMSQQGLKAESSLDQSSSPAKQPAKTDTSKSRHFWNYSNGTSKKPSGCVIKSVHFDEHEEDHSLYADRMKYKPSVWARISGRKSSDKAQGEVVTENGSGKGASVPDGRGSGEDTSVPDYKSSGEGSCLHIYNNRTGEERCSDSGLYHDQETLEGAQHDQRLEDPEHLDRCVPNSKISNLGESGFFVNFKRRYIRKNKDSQEIGNIRSKKRRSLTRPVFLVESSSKHEQVKEGLEFDKLRMVQCKQGSVKFMEEVHQCKGSFDLFCKSDSASLGIQKVVPPSETGNELLGGCLSLKIDASQQPAIIKFSRNGNKDSTCETSEISNANKEPITWAAQNPPEDLNGVIHNFSILLDVGTCVVGSHDVKNFGERILDLNQPICHTGSDFTEMSASVVNAYSTDPTEPGLELELQMMVGGNAATRSNHSLNGAASQGCASSMRL